MTYRKSDLEDPAARDDETQAVGQFKVAGDE